MGASFCLWGDVVLPPKQVTPLKRKPSRFARPKINKRIEKTKNLDGVKYINEYSICRTIGEGLFGKVKLVSRIENGKNKFYAMKILSKTLMGKKKVFYRDENGQMKTKDGFEYLRREVAVFKKIRNNNLISLHQVLQTEQNDKVYLIMELAEKGQLIDWDQDTLSWQFVDPTRDLLNEEELRVIVRGCIKGLYHLHQNNIIHRDLKPQNVLFNAEDEVKISDFGISLLTSELKVNQICGTDYFLAPESFQAEKTKIIDGKALDIWGLGVTLYCFYFLKLPFFDDNTETLIKLIRNQRLTYSRELSTQLRNLFEKMLEKNPAKRATVNELTVDPWVNMGCRPILQQIKSDIIEVSHDDLNSSISVAKKLNISGSSEKTKPNIIVKNKITLLPQQIQISQFRTVKKIELPQSPRTQRFLLSTSETLPKQPTLIRR